MSKGQRSNREKKKKPVLSIKEKRRLKRERHAHNMSLMIDQQIE